MSRCCVRAAQQHSRPFARYWRRRSGGGAGGGTSTGEWVAVEFQLPNVGHSLQTKAVVRHHNQLRCGFEFLGLSRDQRYMIRHWAGNVEPEQSPLEISLMVLLPVQQTAGPDDPDRAGSRSRRSRRKPQPAITPLRTAAVVDPGDVAGRCRLVAAWQWHRGWRQLEARTADERTCMPNRPRPRFRRR